MPSLQASSPASAVPCLRRHYQHVSTSRDWKKQVARRRKIEFPCNESVLKIPKHWRDKIRCERHFFVVRALVAFCTANLAAGRQGQWFGGGISYFLSPAWKIVLARLPSLERLPLSGGACSKPSQAKQTAQASSSSSLQAEFRQANVRTGRAGSVGKPTAPGTAVL